MICTIIDNPPPPSERKQPRPERQGQTRSLYPFARMQVGQAFDAPRDCGITRRGECKRQRYVCHCARSYALRHNPAARFVTRMVDAQTLRCWRVA